MFRIVNFIILLRFVAIATTVICVLAYVIIRRFWIHDLSIFRILSITPFVAMLFILTITTNLTARLIWKSLLSINPSLFPDLNGAWEGNIITEGGMKIPVRAIIRQTLLQTQVDIHTETSKSITMESTPALESGQSKLYYLYRSLPKNPNWNSYVGSTIFDVRRVEGALNLSGYYFTERKTNGRVELIQISKDVTGDVSFY